MWHTHPLKYSIFLDVILFFILKAALEQIWICFMHMTLQFPGCFFWTKVLPLHLHLPNSAILKQVSLSSRIQSGSTCTSFQFIKWVALCTYSSKTEIWKTLWTFKFGSKASWYATCPTLTIFQKAHNIWVSTYTTS